MKKTTAKTIEEYIVLQPEEFREGLYVIYETIRKQAPKAEEGISYQMPAFRFHGMLCYFALFRDHYSFFPGASPIPHFEKQLKGFSISKGTVRLPLDKPIPVKLIGDIVKFRVKENLEKLKAKEEKKKAKKVAKTRG